MQPYTGKFRTIQTIKASDGKLPKEIQVLPLGEWNTMPYGLFKVTSEHLRQMTANFSAGIRKAVPVDVDHDGGKAAGWIKSLTARDDGLYAEVEWTKYGKQLLEDEIYKLFSPEFSLSYVDPEYSTEHGAVLIAGSLTNRPLFKELSYITASENASSGAAGVVLLFSQSNMNLEDIKLKTKEELTPEEVAFLKENSAQLSDEDKAKFGLVDESADEKKKQEEEEAAKKAETEKAEADKAEAERLEAEKKDADAKAKADIEASEKQVTITASELATLKAQAQELTKKKAEDLIGTFIANDKGGKILPKDKDGFVSFYLSCSEEQKPVFEGLLKSLPDVKIAGEIGKGQGATLSAKEEIDAKVKEKIKASETAGKPIDYSQALKLVTKENPELIKQYALDSKPQ